MHLGKEDDCDKCGGTGVNQYWSDRQCWKCGEKDPSSKFGYAKGKGTGKLLEN